MIISRINNSLSKLSIQNKFLVINLTATATALIFAVIMAVHSEYNNSRDSIMQSLEIQAKMVGSNTTAALVFNDKKGAEEVLQAFSASSEVQAAIIFDKEGKVLASYTKKGMATSEDRNDIFDRREVSLQSGIRTYETGFILKNKIDIIHEIIFD